MFAVKRPRQVSNSYKKNASNENLSRPTSIKVGSKPTTVEIRGIPVHFPFTPYACQTEYMTKVIDALNQSQNALLESPTGTGKTLCLLCAALAWQREQARFLPQNNMSQDHEFATSSSQNSNSTSSQKPAKARVPTILYASRTHSQISQVVKELRSTRYRPKHAVLASREQMCVHERVSKLGNAMQLNHECSKLTKERRCRFRLNTETFTYEGTDPTDPAASQPVLDMEDLLTMGTKHKVCPFYFTRGQISDADIVFLPYNYLFDREARKTLGATAAGSNSGSSTSSSSSPSSGQAGINWKNAIVIFDEAHNLEAFASESASFDLTGLGIAGCIGEVDRALGMIQMSTDVAENKKMEVNMIKLKSIFLQMEEYLDKSIPARGGSFRGDYIFEIWKQGAQLTFQNHEIFISFVKQVSDLFMEIRGAAGTPKLDHFVSCLKRTFAGSTEAQCLAKAKAYRVHVTASRTADSNTTPGQFEYRTLSYWCFAPALSMHELAGLGPLRSMLVTSGTLSPLPSYSLELGLPFPVQLENPHIVKPNQIHVRIIGKGVSNKLLKSTYERRGDPEYITELGNTLISLARIIPGGMLVFFPSYGVMEKCVEGWGGPIRRSHNFSEKNRKKNFFNPKATSKRFSFPHAPNYYATNSGSSSPWNRLLSQKAIVVEPKSSADLKPAIEEFDKFLTSKNSTGCILMGVCRGKISEGIDFADHRARAVIITGLPFAPFNDPKVKLKREFLDGVKMEKQIKPTGDGGFKPNEDISVNSNDEKEASTISGAEWYSQQAHRAVNQAVGRVIRHRFDYGSVLLLDSRFAEPRNQSGLSKWVRPYILPNEGFGKAISALAKFYRNAEKDPVLLTRGGTRNQKIEIRYEDKIEEEDETRKFIEESEMIESVAVIQTLPEKHTQNGLAIDKSIDIDKVESSSGYVRPERIIKRYNIHDSKRRREEISTGNQNVLPTLEDEKKNEEKLSSDATISGISLAFSNRNRSLPKFSAGISAVSKNEDMSTTIASAWAGLDRKVSESKKAVSKRPLLLRRRLAEDNLNLSTVKRKDSSVPKEKEKSVNNEIAKLFFKAASANLSKEDFALFRTILVDMQAAGNKKDVRTYLQHASKMIKILLAYENVRVKDLEGQEKLGLLHMLYPLLPKRYESSVRKISNDMIVSKRTKITKKIEKIRAGEKGLDELIKKGRAAKSAIEKAQKKERERILSKSDPNLEAESQDKKFSLMKAEEANSAVKNEIKKLQQNLKPVDRSKIKRSSQDFKQNEKVIEKSVRSSKFSFRADKRRTSFYPSANQYLTQDMDVVDRCLHQASMVSNTYTPEKSQMKFKSNVPKDLICTICDAKPRNPHLANCRHSACLSCWIKWLHRLGEGKGTCPICRAPVKKEELAKMIFKDANSEVPTLSQLCSNGKESSSESEDELEIIGKKK